MRSFVAFTALALSGALDLAAAGPCKPRATTDTSALSETASATETSAYTETSSAAIEATTLAEPPADSIIVNTVTGGGLASLKDFQPIGDVTLDTKNGFKGDGSPDASCASLAAKGADPGRKRQSLGDIAALIQMLTGLNVRTQYTVQFYYYVFTPPRETTSCVLEAFIGSQKFYTTGIFATGASVSYNQVLVSTSVPATFGNLDIRTTCFGGASAVVLVDSIFISNQVTVENIGNYRLDFGDGAIREPANIPTTTRAVEQPTTTQDSATTATEGSNEGTTRGNDNSGEPTTAPEEQQTNTRATQGNPEPTTVAETDSNGPTTAHDNSGDATSAQNQQETNTQTTQGNSEPTTITENDSGDHTTARDNSDDQTTVPENQDRTTQTADAETQPTNTQTEGSDATTARNEPAGTTTAPADDESNQTTATGSEPTTIPADDESNQTTATGSEPTTVPADDESNQTTATGSEQTTQAHSDAAENTSQTHSQQPTESQAAGSETTVSFEPTRPVDNNNQPTGSSDQTTFETRGSPTTTSASEETQGALNNAEPQPSVCLTENLISNGGFENGGDGWDINGNAAITYNGEFGQVNTGEVALALHWPPRNGVKAGFKTTIPSLIPGQQYYLGYGHHTANGQHLPYYECDILVKFDGVNFDDFDPFYDSRAWYQYRNRMNYVTPTHSTVELSFELSCKNNPAAFTLMMDDVFLTSCKSQK
ncbi:hypothetical protein NW762_005469 [Fusarium torreyae]|uniref:Translation initiation factor IF-2 n=1 Tax=Fusarium torreyae TaxID=1237075 RepID=A0A9W8VEY0_9HYPO|nr:hypothetical protein NW762_005469 [Fusarium torreyae]